MASLYLLIKQSLCCLLLVFILPTFVSAEIFSLGAVSRVNLAAATEELAILKELLQSSGLDKQLLSQEQHGTGSQTSRIVESNMNTQHQTILLALLSKLKDQMGAQRAQYYPVSPSVTEADEEFLLLKLLALIKLHEPDYMDTTQKRYYVPPMEMSKDYSSEYGVLKKLLLLFAVHDIKTSGGSGGVVEGYPEGDSLIAAEHLDFNPFAVDSDFVIDVVDITPNQGSGGTVQARESPNTPAMVGQGIALSLFTIQPGAQNLIHYHPRATELLYVINGTIEVGFTDTTGRLIANVVTAGQATLFPHALLHFQRNVGEEVAQYISILNSENPGVMSMPRTFATLPTHILAQALRLNISQIQDFQGATVPDDLRNEFLKSVDGEYDGLAGPNGNAPVEGELVFLPTGVGEPIVLDEDPNDAALLNAVSVLSAHVFPNLLALLLILLTFF